MILALNFTKFLCLLMLRAAEIPLLLWLCGNSFIKKELLFLALADIFHKNNVVGLWED